MRPILSRLVLLILTSAALGYSTILAGGLGIRKEEQKPYIYLKWSYISPLASAVGIDAFAVSGLQILTSPLTVSFRDLHPNQSFVMRAMPSR